MFSKWRLFSFVISGYLFSRNSVEAAYISTNKRDTDELEIQYPRNAVIKVLPLQTHTFGEIPVFSQSVNTEKQP